STGATNDQFDNPTLQTYERMRITANGRVGIGTTAPAQRLSVQGNGEWIGNAANASNLTYNVYKTSDQTVLGHIGDASSGTNAIGISSETADGSFISSFNGGDIELGTDAGGVRTASHVKMVIKND